MLKLSVDRVQNWVMVTGAIRSGTTFLGTVLSFPKEVDYIHEPFHGGYTLPDHQPLRPRYVRPGTQTVEVGTYRDQIERIFSYDIGMTSSQYRKDPWTRRIVKRIVGSRGPFYLRLAKVNPFHSAAVIKCPVGKMTAEYLYLEFGVKPVIVVKHPVSLAASLKRVDWWPETAEFANQQELVEDYFSDELDFLTRTWPSRMLESAAHWRATYKVLLAQANKYSDWHVIKHEDMSSNPVEVLGTLYRDLDLPWSQSIERKIQKLTGESRSAGARNGRVQDFKRNSAGIFELRRNSLSKQERRAIFEVVEDVGLQLYSRESFAID